MVDVNSTDDSAPFTTGHTIRRWARWYDLVSWLLSLGRGDKVRRAAIRIAKLDPEMSLLDLGCGTGTLALEARRAVGPDGHVAGIDASPEMIDVARAKAKQRGVQIDFRVATAERLPYPDAHFDRVVSTFVFHHLPNPVKREALDEIRRVLKPGGSVLIVDFAGGGGPWLHRLAALLVGGHSRGRTSDLAATLGEATFASVRNIQTDYRGIEFVQGDCATD